jgi:hypothetical protein
MGFRFVTGFIGLLLIVTTVIIALSLVYALYNLLQHTGSLLGLQCLHGLSPGNGFPMPQIPQLPCSMALVLTGWRLSHTNSSWPQPLAIVCLLAVSLHQWLQHLFYCCLCVSVAKEMCLPSHYLATAISSGSAICSHVVTAPLLSNGPFPLPVF